MKKNYVTLILLVLFFSSACNAQFGSKSIKGNRDVIVDIRSVSSFDEVHVSSGINLILERSNDRIVKVRTDSNIQPLLTTKVKGSVLHIGIDGRIREATKLDVVVKVPSIVGIHASSGSDVTGRSSFSGNKIVLDASSSADIDLDLKYNTILAECSSGSDITISGAVQSLKVNSSSGSDFDGQELVSKICDAHASSGSDIIVMVNENAELHASSGSDITVYGHPQKVSKHASSGGDIDVK